MPIFLQYYSSRTKSKLQKCNSSTRSIKDLFSCSIFSLFPSFTGRAFKYKWNLRNYYFQLNILPPLTSPAMSYILELDVISVNKVFKDVVTNVLIVPILICARSANVELIISGICLSVLLNRLEKMYFFKIPTNAVLSELTIIFVILRK